MNCPNCGEKMLSESLGIIGTQRIAIAKENPLEFKVVTEKTPSAHYYCEGCDSEWVWSKDKGSIKMIDGRDLGR